MRNHQIRLLILRQFGILDRSALAADFSGVDLRGAHLRYADLRGAKLGGADLTDADLSDPNLTHTNITQAQLVSACGAGTKLPAGLRIRPCPSGADAEAGDRRKIMDQAVPEVGMRAQDSQQPPAHEKFSLESRTAVSVGMGRQ